MLTPIVLKQKSLPPTPFAVLQLNIFPAGSTQSHVVWETTKPVWLVSFLKPGFWAERHKTYVRGGMSVEKPYF